MVISQTPLRISLLGGGTDFRDYFLKRSGAVLTFGLNKYVYVIVKERFDNQIYVNYSKKEIVDHIDELEHELVREAMRITGVMSGVEITTLADIPSQGSGLGSSSAVTVGLLNALHAYKNRQVSAEKLADEACRIEIDILRKPIGEQDQAIAAAGNLCFIEFNSTGRRKVELEVPNYVRRQLIENTLLFYTNRTRSADRILSKQQANLERRVAELDELKALAYAGRDALLNGDVDEVGRLLHRNWEVKKALADGITDTQIDEMYEAGRAAGALGGKVAGAGGGGFLLLYCPAEVQSSVRGALASYRELPTGISRDGSRIVFNINT